MAEPTAVLVPVQLDALVVNDAVRVGANFQRWQANYALLRHRLSPEPPPFAGIDTEFATRPERAGVYLQWQLPEALTTGHQDDPRSEVTFPLVPNRWLVVRTWSRPTDAVRQRVAWIVESDHLDPHSGTSPYATGDGRVTRIGRRIALADGPWSEPGPPEGGAFLTAVGPGIATFAVYQPYNTDVFSLHDTLDELAADQDYVVSYLVAGWYGDIASDPLAGLGPSALADLLEAYDWHLGEQYPDSGSTRMVCHGTVLGLTWHRTGEMPLSPRPDIVDVALGNTADHATAALLDEADPDGSRGPLSPAALLGALQRGVLNEQDEPDGPFAAARRTFGSWFEPTAVGHTWTVEQDPDSAEQGRRARRAARRSAIAFLDRLNSDQAAHDAAVTKLAAARLRLYDLWWARGMPAFPEILPDTDQPGDYQGALEERTAAAESDVERCEASVAQARELIPWGLTVDELDASIRHHAGDSIPGFVLKRTALPDLHRSNEPVVLLRGSKADQAARSESAAALRCRRPDELVIGIYLEGGNGPLVSALDAALPKPPNLPAAPAELAVLVREFAYLDPAGAGELAAAAGVPDDQLADLRASMADVRTCAYGQAPHLGLDPWSQPWSPLYFQWEADYYPITFAEPDHVDEPERAHWIFDGDGYRWDGRGAVTDPITLRGRQFLTATPAQSLSGAFYRYAQHQPAAVRENLRALGDLASRADLISQIMQGFNDQLAGRSLNTPVESFTDSERSRVRRDAVAEQSARLRPPEVASLPVPFAGWPASRFHPVRSGQLAFQRLSMVDRFGRALPIVIPDREQSQRDSIGNGTPASAFRPVLADELRPGLDDEENPITVVPHDAGRFIEFKPRLAQAARTRLDPLSADSDSPLDEAHAGAALCGWVIPNRLDRSLLCFGGDGAPLGAVTAAIGTDGEPMTAWLPLPGSPYARPADLAEDHPHLHELVSVLIERGTDALDSLLRMIDRALETCAPTGDQPPDTTVGRLVGRPLALVRARVRIDLDGPRLTDPAWRNLLDPQPPQLAGLRWPVRLGERDDLGDGLLAYVLEREYDVWHTVLSAEDLTETGDADGYLRPIAAGYALAAAAVPPAEHSEQTAARVTLLADPFGTTHAATGILPTATLRLPSDTFDAALAALAVSFRFGPLPVTPAPEPADDESSRDGDPVPALALPRPPDRHGVWTWHQADPEGGWRAASTVPANPDPILPLPRPDLRTGWLRVHRDPSDEEEDA